MRNVLWLTFLLSFSSCSGIFDDIYDEPQDTEGAAEGKLYIDASSWTDWYYIDLKAVNDSLQVNHLYNPSNAFVQYPIPTDNKQRTTDYGQPQNRITIQPYNRTTTKPSGIYTYWYDVFGMGIDNNEFRSFVPTARQDEPASWSIAVHRNNVRTNGGSAYETDYTSMDELPASSEYFKDAPFAEDEWNEKDVWTIQDQMLQGLIGNQGIEVNTALSSWLKVELPPLPPAFTLNNRIFIVKLQDGTFAAIQLENYQNAAGKKCCLTINYKYPY